MNTVENLRERLKIDSSVQSTPIDPFQQALRDLEANQRAYAEEMALLDKAGDGRSDNQQIREMLRELTGRIV